MTTPQQMEEEMLSNPVRSLQYMLRRLAGKYDFLPQLALDGIFGERTLEAVMLFQRELAPPVTGVVDQRTWDAIRDAWIGLERESAPPRTLRIFPGEGYQVQPGMSGASMILPQTMFQLLRQRLEGIAEGDTDGVHGDVSVQNTVRAVYHRGTPAVKIPGRLLTLRGGPVFNNRVGREPFTQRRRTQ